FSSSSLPFSFLSSLWTFRSNWELGFPVGEVENQNLKGQMEVVEKKELDNHNNNNAQANVFGGDSASSDVFDKEAEERQARELKAGLHPLKHKFVFWYTRRTPGVRTQTSYEDNIKKIVEFSTVETFWVCYCHLTRPSSLPSPTDLHLFKAGIRPLWEDSANSSGGKWIIRFKKVVSGRFWEDLVLALVGDQLEYSDNICGAVLSIRFNEDILSVWNRNASDHQVSDNS
ncbi:Eukaryotic translation initiation factor NCBP, partial [Linum grandiflorum]